MKGTAGGGEKFPKEDDVILPPSKRAAGESGEGAGCDLFRGGDVTAISSAQLRLAKDDILVSRRHLLCFHNLP
jgi:hypothetical protein